MKKILSCLLAVFMISTLLFSCGTPNSGGTSDAGDEQLNIVATIFPPYDWVRQIVGDEAEHANITLLLDNGVDLHSYQPTVEDIATISTCDMFIYVGGESDEWVEDALASATNKDMVVINLLEVLGDAVKEEEIVEGMEHEHEDEHDHSSEGIFEDVDVQDRSLADWQGDWQSVYPYLLDGTLDEVMEHKAEESETMSAEDYHEYYEIGYATDVERIVIDGNIFTFYQNGEAKSAEYSYDGYEILTYESGKKGVRYMFHTDDNSSGAPINLQFSDHGIAPQDAEHFHLFFGDETHAQLLTEMDNWPTYYSSELSADALAAEMLNHEHSHEGELDEHVWLSLKHAQTLCGHIAGKLADLDPENAADYEANAAAYVAQLADLDRDYQDAVTAAQGNTLLFADRFPFRYLADDYGLDYYAAFAGCSAETEASFETIVFLAEKLDELGLQNILVIESSDQSMAQTVKQSTQAKNQQILVLDSLQSVTAAHVAEGASYLAMMQTNLETLKVALG